MAKSWKDFEGKTRVDGEADARGTIGKSWTAAEITAQSDAERLRGNYWHPTLGGVTVVDFALLTVPDQLLCLAPI